MITLIGHGYIGKNIAAEMCKQNLPHYWILHTDSIPKDTSAIINAAGYTGSPNVDACEMHKQETINGNVIWPVLLENSFPTTPIIHISTGCVYTGYQRHFTEDDSPNFDFNNGSFYSGSKALAQKLLLPFMDKSYLLRVRMPFGDEEHPRNLLTKMKNYQKLVSYDNSLSYMPDVAKFAIACAVGGIPKGIYNVCNPGFSNALEIIGMMGIEKEFLTDEQFKQTTLAPRSNCILSTDKIQSVFPIQNIKTALLKAITNLKYLP